MKLNLSSQIASDIVHYTKYARYKPEEYRKENFKETVRRNLDMHLETFQDNPEVCTLLNWAYYYVFKKEVLPSMRALQFSGKAIRVNPARGFNCAFAHVDSIDSFSEIMFLLLSGCGVGYSVQRHHIRKLPALKMPRVLENGTRRKRRHLIADDIEGWADALKVLLRAYFEGLSDPDFDFSAIRKKGSILKTSGGKAPGAQPLKEAIIKIRGILDNHESGDSLTPLECHDIICHMADAVLAGGIRRSALACLFSFDDKDMLYCKSGEWWISNPQRGRSNNSAVIVRQLITKEDLYELWNIIRYNNSGEPGFFFTNDPEYGFNPCFEASILFGQFCNLVTANALAITSQSKFNDICKALSIIATVQAYYTDFHYLREFWKENTERDALLGVSITGISSGTLDNLDLEEGAKIILDTNAYVADLIGINKAARTTLVKPEGSTSLVFGTSSGIHDWFSKYYIRRITILKDDPIYFYLKENVPHLLEDNKEKPHLEAFICVPMEAPEGASIDSSTFEMLERVKRFNTEWIAPGHRSGPNQHNVSCTIYIGKDEWDDVFEWIWDNKHTFACMSFFPKAEGIYTQAPHESITKERYLELVSLLKELNMDDVAIYEDNTDFSMAPACAGGVCEIL